MDEQELNQQNRFILQYIRRVISNKKKCYLDHIKRKVRNKFKFENETIELFFNDMIQKKMILVDEGLVEINIFANPTRRKIFELIKAYPGIYTYLIKNILNIGPNQVDIHLSVLEMNNLIKYIDFGKVRVYGVEIVPEIQIYIGFLAFKKSSRKILIFLCRNALGPKRSEIMEYISLSKSATIYWIKKLIKLRLIYVRINHVNHYYLSKHYKKIICTTMQDSQEINHISTKNR